MIFKRLFLEDINCKKVLMIRLDDQINHFLVSHMVYQHYFIQKCGLGLSSELAASIISIYGSLVYLLSIVGGFISDRILGSRKTVLYGGILIMFGHIALSLPLGEAALFVSIILITLGTGFLKPNISEMVGDLYTENDNRRDSGFTIFVFGINFGSFIAPILVGYLGQHVNFHLGFSLADIGMFFWIITVYSWWKTIFTQFQSFTIFSIRRKRY